MWTLIIEASLCSCLCWPKYWALAEVQICKYLPLFGICITVAVVLRIGAVFVYATGTLFYSRSWSAPIKMLLAASANPPCVRGPIYEWNTKCKGQPVSLFHPLCIRCTAYLTPCRKAKQQTKMQTSVEEVKLFVEPLKFNMLKHQ